MTTPTVENGAGPPAPPPPPPMAPTQPSKLPCEISLRREPPAVIQNAMMKESLKPFSYLPGGIDLSQIKSPGMARRLQKNAMSEGVQAPRSIPPPTQPPDPQPISKVPIQPSMPPPPPPQLPPISATDIVRQSNQLNHPPKHMLAPKSSDVCSSPSNPPSSNNTPISIPNTPEFHQPSPPRFIPQSGPISPQSIPASPPPSFIPQTPTSQIPQSPPTPSSVPQSPRNLLPQQLGRQAPDQTKPKLNNENVKGNAQLGSLYIPPIDKDTKIPGTPSTPGSGGIPQLQKAPLPWMTTQAKNQSPPPSFMAKRDTPLSPVDALTPPVASPIQSKKNPIVWIPSPQENLENVRAAFQSEARDKHTRIIPISVERDDGSTYSTLPESQQVSGPSTRWQTSPERHSINNSSHGIQNIQISSANGRTSDEYSQPTQSKSFRVLQMIADAQDQTPIEPGPMSSHPPAMTRLFPSQDTKGQPRLLLSDGDKELMKMFKQQVDEDSSLHEISDPRYKGSYIPSKTFRRLQDWTSSGDTYSVPDSEIPITHPTNLLNDNSPMASQQDQLPEPKKYTGGAIPSRSFRILQQMTDTGADEQPSPASGYSILAQMSDSPDSPVRNPGPTIAGDDTSTVDVTPNVKPNKYKTSDIPSRIFRQLEQEYPAGSGDRVLTAGAPNNPNANPPDLPTPLEKRPSKYMGGNIPSRAFRQLQSGVDHGTDSETSVRPASEQIEEPDYQEDKMLKSKTFRSLQQNPSAHPSVFGRRAK